MFCLPCVAPRNTEETELISRVGDRHIIAGTAAGLCTISPNISAIEISNAVPAKPIMIDISIAVRTMEETLFSSPVTTALATRCETAIGKPVMQSA